MDAKTTEYYGEQLSQLRDELDASRESEETLRGQIQDIATDLDAIRERLETLTETTRTK